MGFIGGIIGVAIFLVIWFAIGSAKKAPTYGKLQRLCAKDPKTFRQAAIYELCWDIEINNIKHSGREGWNEFIPYPGNSPVSIWLRYNGAHYINEQEALNALIKRIESSSSETVPLDSDTGVSAMESIVSPTSFPPVNSIISYHVLSDSGLRLDTVKKLKIVAIHDTFMMVRDGEDIRAMSFGKYVDLFTNPAMKCKVTPPVSQSH